LPGVVTEARGRDEDAFVRLLVLERPHEFPDVARAHLARRIPLLGLHKITSRPSRSS
jgi:hypothetical protein